MKSTFWKIMVINSIERELGKIKKLEGRLDIEARLDILLQALKSSKEISNQEGLKWKI